MALSQCIKKRFFAQNIFEFHTGVKKCHFGNFQRGSGWSCPVSTALKNLLLDFKNYFCFENQKNSTTKVTQFFGTVPGWCLVRQRSRPPIHCGAVACHCEMATMVIGRKNTIHQSSTHPNGKCQVTYTAHTHGLHWDRFSLPTLLIYQFQIDLLSVKSEIVLCRVI